MLAVDDIGGYGLSGKYSRNRAWWHYRLFQHTEGTIY